MYLWSLTFLIIPAALLVGGVVAFFAIKAIAKKVKRKAQAQALSKQDQSRSQSQNNEKSTQPTFNPEQFIDQTPAQPTPAPQTQQESQAPVSQAIIDASAPHTKLSDAQYIKQMATLPFDAKDNAIVLGDKQKHTEWLIATQKLNDPEASDEERTQAQTEIASLNQYFENTYGHKPTMPSPANFAASVKDENQKTVYDFRNYCFDGNGAQTFKSVCENEYSAQEGDDMPTIFQVDIEKHPSLIVSSTQEDMFKAGIKDIKSTITAQNIGECTFHIITDSNGRKLVSQKGTIKDIDAFINNVIYSNRETSPIFDQEISK